MGQGVIAEGTERKSGTGEYSNLTHSGFTRLETKGSSLSVIFMCDLLMRLRL